MLTRTTTLPRGLLGLALAAPLVLAPRSVGASEGAGTLAEPIVIDAFPFADEGDTRGAGAQIDAYACAAATSEAGPEVVYRVALAQPGRVLAWVTGDMAGAVDIDVQILADATLNGRTASCVARGDRFAEADLPAGEHFVTVDTFAGAATRPGPFVLRVDFLPADTTRERLVAQGVRWRSRLASDLFGGPQVVNMLDVDLAAPGLALRPVQPGGCRTVASIGAAAHAVAGVNAGFFDTGTGRCDPVSLVRIDDAVLGSYPMTEPPRSAMGLSDFGPRIERVAWDDPWSAVRHAVGGTPQLVRDGAVAVLGAEEGTGASFVSGQHPRTAACITGEGHVLFVTFDGRSESGSGVSLPDLATYLLTLGCVTGLNYDGGGSTTMWVDGQPASGVVNYPSDLGQPVHNTGRAVANGWFVFASPVNHPPRFVSEPVTAADVGRAYVYDADARDLDLQPIAFALVSGPDGMRVGADDGVVQWTPGEGDRGDQPVLLRASDGVDFADQSFVVRVPGGAVADAGRGDAARDGGDALYDGGADGGGGVSAGGCGCRAVREVRGYRGAGSALVLASLAAWARRRRRAANA